MTCLQGLSVAACRSMHCTALFASTANVCRVVRHRFQSYRRVAMPSLRYHDSSALQELPDVIAAVDSAASLEELVTFCSRQRLKPTVYTGRSCRIQVQTFHVHALIQQQRIAAGAASPVCTCRCIARRCSCESARHFAQASSMPAVA
jgi:hypothetical protein